MVGERYWSTGITIHQAMLHEWVVSLVFFDDGFSQHGSTEGTMRVRYATEDLEAAIDTLKADAERMGIRWNEDVPGSPTVYAGGDDRGDDAAVRMVANEQARRIGWEPCYTEEEEEEEEVHPEEGEERMGAITITPVFNDDAIRRYADQHGTENPQAHIAGRLQELAELADFIDHLYDDEPSSVLATEVHRRHRDASKELLGFFGAKA